MSRVLMLLPSVPEPADAGAKLRNRGLIGLLRQEHEVDALAFGTDAERVRLAPLVDTPMVVPTPRARRVPRRALELVRSPLPDMAARLWSPTFRDALTRMLRKQRYDAVQAEGIEMARYLAVVRPEQRVYDAHNAEFLLQRRASETAPSLQAGLYSRIQWRRLARFESRLVRTSRLTLAVSEHDANQLRALSGPGADVQVVPNGVDASAFEYTPRPESPRPDLLFLGKLDFRPNAEAVRWLIEQVLPALQQSEPNARLFVVGPAPPPWLVRAGQHDPRIAVTGQVSDERPYLARCAALLLPLRFGGGSRFKALVALATGAPIVSSSLGMEGLEAEPGRHFLRAESASDYVSAVGRVVHDASLRRELAARGRALVERCYDWSALAPRVRAAYRDMLR